jgi:hypothetical protein
MSPKISSAAQATDEILALGAEARDHLQTAFTGSVLNGLGVVADVPALSRRIDLARAALARAAALVAATDWPNDGDYDDETNCPLFASGGEPLIQAAALSEPDARQSRAGETVFLQPMDKNCVEQSAVVDKAEAVEHSAVAGEAEAVENSAVVVKAEAVENSSVAGKAEAVENSAVAGKAEAVENSAAPAKRKRSRTPLSLAKQKQSRNSAVTSKAGVGENSAALTGKVESVQKITFPLFLFCFGGGLLAAMVGAAICWVVVDAIVPAAANVGLGFFMESWRASPSFHEFINAIDVCALANVFLFRAETILGASVLLIGFRVGYQIRQLIAVGARPVFSIIMVNFVMMVLICITLALLVLDFSPTVVPRSSSCEFPFFDRSGVRF